MDAEQLLWVGGGCREYGEYLGREAAPMGPIGSSKQLDAAQEAYCRKWGIYFRLNSKIQVSLNSQIQVSLNSKVQVILCCAPAQPMRL